MTISQIQHLLAYLGFYTAPVDGVWGAQSQQAAVDFQKSEQLDPDGIPGKDTQQALRNAVAREETSDFWATVPNFSPAEFVCPCGCGQGSVEPALVRVCQRLRRQFDAPFEISSGRRCPAHNAQVGGVPTSRHLTGRAVDFRIRGQSAPRVLAAAQSQPEIRYAYAIDETYVHMELA